MGWISWIIIGGLAGWLATKVMGVDGDIGVIGNILIGIIGGLVGGFLMNLIGGQGVTGFNPWSLLVCFIGAVVTLWLARKIRA